MTANRFLERGKGPRVAAFVTWGFPSGDQAGVYAELDALAQVLGAEVRVFHSGVTDPTKLPEAVRGRVGSGFYVPNANAIHANDVEHFRRTAPARFTALVTRLCALAQQSETELLARPDIQAAMSCARWVQAWGADYVHSWYLYEQSLYALVVAQLLGIPRGITLHAATSDSPLAGLLPLHLEQARLVIAGNSGLRDEFVRRFGEGLRTRTLVQHAPPPGEPAPLEALRAVLAEPLPADATARGPDAAFVTPRQPTALRSGGPKPFLVLGAERTGSNLLVTVLGSQSSIACAGELFNPRFIQERTVPWLHGQGNDLATLLALRGADPAAFHARLLADGVRNRANWVGFKLLYFHGMVDDRIVDHLAAQRDLTVIHLFRKDRIRRWLSHRRAVISDSWYTPKGARRAPEDEAPLVLEVVPTLTDFMLQELMEERYTAVFREHRGLQLDYDDFTNDLPGTGRKLSALFAEPLGELVPKSKKTGTHDLARGIANLDELRAAFAGTRWSGLFPD